MDPGERLAPGTRVRRLWAALLLVIVLAAVVAMRDEGGEPGFARLLASLRDAVSFEPAARRERHDGTLDAFQRAWDHSERRVDEQLGARPPAGE